MKIQNKENILLYRLTEKEKEALTSHFGKQYELVDASDSFSDILALPARMVVLNPDALTDEEYQELNESFEWMDETLIVFSGYPRITDPDKELPYSYYVEDDIEHVSDLHPLKCEKELDLIDDFKAAVDAKDDLISEIGDAIYPEGAHRLDITSRIATLKSGDMLFRNFLDLVQQGDKRPSEERVTYRRKLMDALMAMKLADGL